LNYGGGVGGVRWWNGPDEDLGYVIAQSVPTGTQPNPDNTSAFVGFFRSSEKNEESFLSIANTVQAGATGEFTTGEEAVQWLNGNGYWTSYSSFVNPTLTIGSAVNVVSQSPFISGGNSYSFISNTNSFIDTPGSSNWAPGTGDFTIEWFSYQTSISNFPRIFSVGSFPSASIAVSIEGGTFYYWANSSFRFSSSAGTILNSWVHWAVVRQSGVTKVYKNGIQLGSQITDTNNITNSSTFLTIGNETVKSTGASLVGFLTNLRWVDGVAVYTGNFTVPTSDLTAVAGTNPYGGSNTQAIPAGATKLLLIP
jgi:hypothetical protein